MGGGKKHGGGEPAGEMGSIVKGVSKFSASGEDFTPIPQ